MSENKEVNVIFPDSTNKLFSIDSKITSNDLKIIVAESLDLKVWRLFGFYLKDENGNLCWLADGKSIFSCDIINNNKSTQDFYFSFKYFQTYDDVKTDVIANYFFFHHVKSELYNGNLEITDESLCLELLTLSLLLSDESKIIKYEIVRKIIPAFFFAIHPSFEYCTRKIQCIAKDLSDLDSDSLMQRFMSHIANIPYQLKHYFDVKDCNSALATIGIGSKSLVECDKNSKNSVKLRYNWPNIINFKHNKSRITFEVADTAISSNNNRSTLRRKSIQSSLAYDAFSPTIAKHIVYLIRDIISFVSKPISSKKPTIASSAGDINKLEQQKQPRNTLSSLKKSHLTSSGGSSNSLMQLRGSQDNNHHNARNQVARRPSFSGSIASGHSQDLISRSPSRLSLSSSTINGSFLTNDSGSIHNTDHISMDSTKTLEELQQIFQELNIKRQNIISQIKHKRSQALELCISESTITGKTPDDYHILCPNSKIKLTQFQVPLRFLDNNNKDAFEEKKQTILLEIETLNNIVLKLKKSDKKERQDKNMKILSLQNQLRSLELEHAYQNYNGNSYLANRSSSTGNLHLIASPLLTNQTNGQIPTTPNRNNDMTNQNKTNTSCLITGTLGRSYNIKNSRHLNPANTIKMYTPNSTSTTQPTLANHFNFTDNVGVATAPISRRFIDNSGSNNTNCGVTDDNDCRDDNAHNNTPITKPIIIHKPRATPPVYYPSYNQTTSSTSSPTSQTAFMNNNNSASNNNSGSQPVFRYHKSIGTSLYTNLITRNNFQRFATARAPVILNQSNSRRGSTASSNSGEPAAITLSALPPNNQNSCKVSTTSDSSGNSSFLDDLSVSDISDFINNSDDQTTPCFNNTQSTSGIGATNSNTSSTIDDEEFNIIVSLPNKPVFVPCRDSREITQYRLMQINSIVNSDSREANSGSSNSFSVSRRPVHRRINPIIRRSMSLEDVQEDISLPISPNNNQHLNIQSSSSQQNSDINYSTSRRGSCQSITSPILNGACKLTIKPSTRDVNRPPASITRGRQPSINFKQAHVQSSSII